MSTKREIYSIRSTGVSSNMYGNCEVCNKPVADVHTFVTKKRNLLFGHKECLIEQIPNTGRAA